MSDVIGLNPDTGHALVDTEHLRASVRDILTTPIGTRVMRRTYGSRLFELIDSNLNALTLVQIYAAVADALAKWEPRLKVTRVQAHADESDLSAGKITIDLEGEYLPGGQTIQMEGLIL